MNKQTNTQTNINRPRSGVDARADLPARGPLPGGASEAAAALLELAMDEKLLSRAYVGWAPHA